MNRSSPRAGRWPALLLAALGCALPGLALANRSAAADPALQGAVDSALALAEVDVGALALRAALDAAAQAHHSRPWELFDLDAVRGFYGRRDFAPAWAGDHCDTARQQLLDAIAESYGHGLDPLDYHQQALAVGDDCDAAFELLATDAWLMLAAHLQAGRIDPLSVESNWTAERRSSDLGSALQHALAHNQIASSLAALAPQDGYYAELRAVLAAERQRPPESAPPQIDAGASLRRGDQGARVAQLRARLRWLGALAEPIESIESGRAEIGETASAEADAESVFDESLEGVIRELQRRANLEPDGVVGAQTLALLQRDRAARIDQLRANLERWRWLPADLGERHIRVNIANFSLEARAGGRVERLHSVIVGSAYRRTPSFSARLRYLVLNPWWEVPRKLAVQDKLPLFRRDPGAFARLGFELRHPDGSPADPTTVDFSKLSKNYFPYRLRQRPGPANALGQIKLILPNRHDVYLHDTPSRGLFARVRRDFSSGCIRVEHVAALAEWVLADTPGWNRERIEAGLAQGSDLRADLAASLPVHLLYLTVVADPALGVRYLDDLYDRDAPLVAALDSPPKRAKAVGGRG